MIKRSPPQDLLRALGIDRPTIGSWGGAISYERGTPVRNDDQGVFQARLRGVRILVPEVGPKIDLRLHGLLEIKDTHRP